MSTDTRLPRLNRARIPLALLGGVVFALGVAVIVEPSTAESLPIEPVLELLGNEYVLVAAFGVAAILVVLAVLLARVVSGINQATPPDPEEVHRVPRFGESFDEFVSDAGVRAWLLTDRHRTIRTRLRDAAITTVIRESNCTRDEARERVERGAWTDDPEAAAFLAETGELGLAARVVAALRGESPFQRAARRTAAEITNYDAGEEP